MKPSNDSSVNYLLCVRRGPLNISEFRIENKDVYFKINDRAFDCLKILIDFYREKGIVEGHPLREPVCKSPSNVNLQQLSEDDIKSAYKEFHTATADLQLKISKEIIHQGDLNLWTTETDSCMKSMNAIMGCRLYIYETMHHIKHIALIDLSQAKVYECHKSLLNREYCFQIIESMGRITNFHARNEEDYNAWITALKSQCNSSVRNTVKQYSTGKWRHDSIQIEEFDSSESNCSESECEDDELEEYEDLMSQTMNDKPENFKISHSFIQMKFRHGVFDFLGRRERNLDECKDGNKQHHILF